MSHSVDATVVIKNEAAAIRAAEKLGFSIETNVSTRMFDGKLVEGCRLMIPSWSKPVGITKEGTMVYDNYNGHWGSQDLIDKFTQEYSRQQVIETALQNGYTLVSERVSEETGEIEMEFEVPGQSSEPAEVVWSN